jgi:MFS family permease
VVIVYAITNALSYADRTMVTLLVQPIKHDFGFSDVQMGLITGLSFGLAYAVFSLPVGRLVDRFSRKWIATAGITIWTAMTALCGTVGSFGSLFAFRFGTGIGEAVVYPTAMSSAADYMPRSLLSRAIGTIITGGFLGSGIAFIVGGLIIRSIGEHGSVVLPYVGQVAAWRVTFLAAAAPGVLVALLMALTVPEPARRNITSSGESVPSQGDHLPVSAVWRYFATHRRLLACLIVGMGFCTLYGQAQSVWAPAFIVRTYHWTTSSVGVVSGVISIFTGAIGPLASAVIADRLLARGRHDALIKTALCAVAIAIPVCVAALLAPNAWSALTLQGISSLFLQAPFPLAAATIQMIVPNRMRGQITASYLFFINMLGLGLGPLAVGFITDHVFNEQMIRYSLILWCVIVLPLAVATLSLVLAPLRKFLQAP